MIRFALTPLAAAFALAALAPAEAASIRNGAAIARKNCGACHAIGKTGESGNPKAPAFRTLAAKYPLDNLQEALAEGIVVGHEGTDMPEFTLTPRQIDDLIAHIRSVTPKR